MNRLSCLSFPSVKSPVWRDTIQASSSLFGHITRCLTPIPHLIYSFIHLADIYWVSTHKWVAWVLGIQLPTLPSVWFYMIRTWRNSDVILFQCPHTAEASHWSVWCIPGMWKVISWAEKHSPAEAVLLENYWTVLHSVKLHFLRSQQRIVNLSSEILNCLSEEEVRDRWKEIADEQCWLLTPDWT